MNEIKSACKSSGHHVLNKLVFNRYYEYCQFAYYILFAVIYIFDVNAHYYSGKYDSSEHDLKP